MPPALNLLANESFRVFLELVALPLFGFELFALERRI